MTRLDELADRYRQLPAAMRALAEQYPGAQVVRNAIGNLAILTAGGEYVGWVDVLAGTVEEVGGR
jgi:hypothetical protein